ncbi:T9SS type A sorting domain-containing protein [Ekhidna sp.]
MKKTYLPLFLFLLIMLGVGSVKAQQPELVEDINTKLTRTLPSFSQKLESINGKLFFRAALNGTELGVYDGTTFEPFELYEFGNSEPENFTAVGEVVYFSAREEGTGGAELYQYLNGEVSLIDINPSGASNPGNLIEYDGALYFSAEDATNGTELWKYDGTTATVIDIQTGSGSSEPEYFYVFNNELLFFADDGVVGNELWKYDGTNVSLLEDIRTGAIGSVGSNGPSFARNENIVVFQAFSELYQYDGTNVTLAADINPTGGSTPRNITEFNGIFYFSAFASVDQSTELWQYDGTTASLVSDIYPGSESSQVNRLVATDDYLYFVARDGVSEKDLYKYDGTTITSIDVNPNNSDRNGEAFIDFLTAIGNTVYFQGYGSVEQRSELWKYDGTTLTEIVIRPGEETSAPRHITELNGEIYFTALEGSGTQGWHLWRYDGIDASVVVTNGINEGSNLFNLVGDGERFYFTATEDNIESNIFTSDGTITSKISDISSTPVGEEHYELTAFNGGLAYLGYDDEDDGELYVFYGADVQIFDINTEGSSEPEELEVVNDILYFAATDTDGRQIYQFNGTEVSLAFDLVTEGIGQPRDFYAAGDDLYFTAQNATVGRELFKFDGTDVTLVTDLNPSSSTSVYDLFEFNEMVYFVANTPSGRELCKYDGTAVEIIDINPGNGSSFPFYFTEYDGKLFFSADDGSNGNEFWSYDGTDASIIDIRPGSLGSSPGEFTQLNGVLYFRARTNDTGSELFKYDGTSASLARDINEGNGNSYPSNLFAHGPYLYFTAANFSGAEDPLGDQIGLSIAEDLEGLWRFDGTNLDFITEFNLDEDDDRIFLGNYVYLAGDTDELGTELYRIRAISEEVEILTFSLAEQSEAASIDEQNRIITVKVPAGTDVTELTPDITISELASIDLDGAQDFTNSVIYTVTSEFGNTQAWIVTVDVDKYTGTDILSFAVENQTGDASIDLSAHIVSLTVSRGTDVTSLAPEFTLSPGASISPEGAQDFTNAFVYTVTAEDGSTQGWTVEVQAEQLSGTDMLTFSVSGQVGSSIIDATAHTVSVIVPFDANITALNPTITISEGASISPEVAQDFTNTVTYTIAAENGGTQDWTVTITKEDPPLGLDDVQVSVYPNPSSDFIQVDAKQAISVKMLDLNGRSIQSKAGNTIQLDIQSLQPGIYILRISDGKQTINHRIIKAN